MLSRKLALAAAGNAAGDPIYVDDIFGIRLRDGNGTSASSTAAVVNGIDLSGEGGIVWVKERNSNNSHTLFSTDIAEVSGKRPYLSTNGSSGTNTKTNVDINFNSNGYIIEGHDGSINQNNGNIYVDWTFRKCPGFFDVVTYTGNGSNSTISHNLGSQPGMIWVKKTSVAQEWAVYHRGKGATHYGRLSGNQAFVDNNTFWNDTEPTSSVFSVGTSDWVNTNNETYIAYIFAHDDQSFGDDGDEAVIKCGSYTGNGSTSNFINLGFEPQWLLIKRTNSSKDWMLFDNARGIFNGSDDTILEANQDFSESNFSLNLVSLNPTGFSLVANNSDVNGNYDPYIYVAIRRSHKTPEDAADVFQPDLKSSNQTISTDFPVDLCVAQYTGGGAPYWIDRMRGIFTDGTDHVQKYLNSSSTAAQGNDTGSLGIKDFNSVSYEHSLGNFEQATLAFKRAKGFFDIVTYTGTTSTSNNVGHNLGVVPNMMILKKTNGTGEWAVRTVGSGDVDKTGFQLNRDYATTNQGFGTVGLTTTTFNPYYIGTSDGTNGTYPDNALNSSGDSYIAYLFANLAGVSKVGAYSGTGNNINVDCGFTAGARFVMIKRTDSNGDWFYWNTALGINSGDDPYLRLNSNGSKVTNTDYIDPLNAGFTVTSSAPAALNTSGGKYIFLAIA